MYPEHIGKSLLTENDNCRGDRGYRFGPILENVHFRKIKTSRLAKPIYLSKAQ